MSSKLYSVVRYAYMRIVAPPGECLRVKADMVLFASNTVLTISERVIGVHEDALYTNRRYLYLYLYYVYCTATTTTTHTTTTTTTTAAAAAATANTATL